MAISLINSLSWEKGQSQLVKEFGVIKLLAEDVSEEKATKLH